jgi:sec-independent protein translocase protein TatA
MESVMFGIGTTELLVVLGIVIVIFGARRLPELGSGLGKAIKNFKAGVSGKDEIDVTPDPEKVTEGDKDS